MSPLSLSLEDEPLRAELEAQLTHELCKRGFGASLALLPAVWMMWEVAGTHAAARPWVTPIFVAEIVVVTLRLVWLTVMRARRAWGTRAAFLGYWASSVAIGLANGAIVMTTVPALDPVQQAMLTVCLIGINGIGVVSMAPSPTVYVTHASWNLAALLWASVAQPIPGYWFVFPVMVVVYTAWA